MTFSTTTLVRFIAKLTRCLSLVLLPALASEAHALSHPQRKPAVRSAPTQPAMQGAQRPNTSPYLAALGPRSLSFAHPAPERSDEPPASPEPKVAKTEAPVTAPAKNVDQENPAPPHTASQTVETTQTPAPVETETLSQPPLPILPDDTSRELRPEDVLMFFRYPESARSSRRDAHPEVVVPVTVPVQSESSSPAVPSSATYEQTK